MHAIEQAVPIAVPLHDRWKVVCDRESAALRLAENDQRALLGKATRRAGAFEDVVEHRLEIEKFALLDERLTDGEHRRIDTQAFDVASRVRSHGRIAGERRTAEQVAKILIVHQADVDDFLHAAHRHDAISAAPKISERADGCAALKFAEIDRVEHGNSWSKKNSTHDGAMVGVGCQTTANFLLVRPLFFVTLGPPLLSFRPPSRNPEP